MPWTGDLSEVNSCVFSLWGGWNRLQAPYRTECRCSSDIWWCGNEKALWGPISLFGAFSQCLAVGLFLRLSLSVSCKKAMHLIDHLDWSQEMSQRVALSATLRILGGFNHAATWSQRALLRRRQSWLKSLRWTPSSRKRLLKKFETYWGILWKMWHMSRPENSPLLLQIFIHVTVYWAHRENANIKLFKR